jgi:hypothetical protein
MQWRDR